MLLRWRISVRWFSALHNSFKNTGNFSRGNLRSSALCRRLTAKYNFEKPNDRRALDLMNAAAAGVMEELPDLVMGYGISDEFRCARQL